MNRQKPRYRKRGNLIELPFANPGIPESELTFALAVVHVERKLREDPDFSEYPERAIQALGVSIAKKVQEYKRKNPEKSLGQASAEVIETEKRMVREKADACADNAWKMICRTVNSEISKVSLNDIIAVLGKEFIEKYGIRKTWAIAVCTGKSKDEILDALSHGKYRIQESARKVVIFPEFD